MNKSESIGNLSCALSKFQGEVQDIHKSKSGYGYKYADLGGVLEITRPLCQKYELSVSQLCSNSEDNPDIVGVETVLMHSSGEWISSTMYMTQDVKKNLSSAQASGSVITYARRYALAAILGITQIDNDASLRPAKEDNAALVSSLNNLIAKQKIQNQEISSWLNKAQVNSIRELNLSQLAKLIDMLEMRENGR